MRFPDKPEAKVISWKLWQASGVKGNQGENCQPSQFMSTDAHFKVKIGFKFQSPLGKISNILTSDPSSFRSIITLWATYYFLSQYSPHGKGLEE